MKPAATTADVGYLPLKALAGYSGLSVRTLRGYLAHPLRPLPHFRVGGRILVKRLAFDTWMDQFRAESRPKALDGLVDDVMASLR